MSPSTRFHSLSCLVFKHSEVLVDLSFRLTREFKDVITSVYKIFLLYRIILEVFLHLCLQVPRVDVEAVKGEVLRVSNRSCESVTLVGNTLECTVPPELNSGTRDLEVEVRKAC